jgi:hypothetical protein
MTSTAHTLRIILRAILFVCVLELCARLDDYITFHAPILGLYDSNILYEYDQLGKHGKPFARYRKWQMNEFGYRGPRFEKDRHHAITFGASETFGLYESDDREYPRQLERELNERAGSHIYQVVNIAYPGETLPTATLRVPEIVARIHPQIALIYSSPAFYIDKRLNRMGEREKEPLFQLRIFGRLHDAIKAAMPELLQTRIREWEIRRSIGSTLPMDRLPEESVDRYRKDLIEIVSSLRANGVQPVLITHATTFGAAPHNPDHAMLVAWRKFYPNLKEDGFLDLEQRMNEATREIAVQNQITLVDVAREIPPGNKYFADFVHFTDDGAAVMAKLIADAIEPLFRQYSSDTNVNRTNARPQSTNITGTSR